MNSDENDAFDESVDPYDRSVDFEYDDGIKVVPVDELDEADEADWDVYWEDESKTQAAQSDEMADYDELDD
jgi:hypothetical protein